MKIAVLTSGGVDSSLALAMLKEQGFDVTAFYLKIWLEDELSYLGQCPWQEDLGYVQKLCSQLNVPLEIINLQKEYHSEVISLALNQIRQGQTPNPDIFCNTMIKFGAFFKHMKQDFDLIATGHYAKVERNEFDKTVMLKTSPDKIKDQTYFLAKLSQEQLQKALFPLGDLTKSEVRELAEKFNLPSKNRKDSQGLCFLGKINFEDFIKANVGEQAGKFIEFESGKVMGNHNGFWFYTIGQRKGIGLSHGPWYVVQKDPEKNIVFISNQYHDTAKPRNKFLVDDFSWITKPSKQDLLDLRVKLRHGPESYSCTLDGDLKSKTTVFLNDARDQGISPGQFAVFYSQDICLGSAMIVQEL